MQRVEVENPMVLPRPIVKYTPPAEYRPECECGARAHVKVQNNLRCWECAEEEGIERI